MSALTVGVNRLSATYRLDDGDDAARRLNQIFERVAERGLDRAATETDLPPGEWCVGRVDAQLSIRLSDSDASIETQWSSALVDALREAITSRDSEVVHYTRRRDALIELVGDIAAGRFDRVWAWEQLGVRSRSDPSPSVAPGNAILAALCRSPHDALSVIVIVAGRIGLDTLDRRLGSEGWLAIIEIVMGSRSTSDERWRAEHDRVRGRQMTTPGSVPPISSQRVAATVISSSSFIGNVRRSRLRIDDLRAHCWAVLSALEVDPLLWSRGDVDHILFIVAAKITSINAGHGLRGISTETEGRDQDPSSAETIVDDQPLEVSPTAIGHGSPIDEFRDYRGAGASQLDSLGSTDDRSDWVELDRQEAPGDHDERVARDVRFDPGQHGQHPGSGLTQWAGLLFLLNVADSIDLIDEIVGVDEFVDRTVRWVLHTLARQLVPLSDEDAACLAFAGLDPSAEPPSRSGPPPSPAEAARLSRLGARLALEVRGLLGRIDQEADEVVKAFASRSGEIVGEPGWIEVHLSMQEIDVEVRLAGLDLDPGWVPWLGSVVRFVYDD